MSIQIELDHPHGPQHIYFAGDVVVGRVVVRASRGLLLASKELQILLMGRERVELHTSERNMGQIAAKIIKEVQILKTCNYEPNNVFVDAHETFTYPFNFQLPENIPSSFKSKFGVDGISYFLEARSSCPSLKNEPFRLPFIVNGVLDLNLEPQAFQKQACSEIKKSNLLVGRRGDIIFRLNLPRKSGFAPGEILEFHAFMQNNSNKVVIEVIASLIQVVCYSLRGEVEKETKVIASVWGPTLDQGERKLWKPVDLIIPEVPPSHLGRSIGNRNKPPFIDVQYFLQLKLVISGLSRSLRGRLPVWIGTTPLSLPETNIGHIESDQERLMIPDFPSTATPDVETDEDDELTASDEPGSSNNFEECSVNPPSYEDVAGSTSNSILLDYPDLPPPSYSEAVTLE